MVRLEPVKSAEPPMSSGSMGPNASSAFCEALREAMSSVFPAVSCMNVEQVASQLSGNSLSMRRWNSSASSGYAFL